VKLDKAFVTIDEILANRNPDYKGVLEPIFVKSQLSVSQVAGLINLFSNEKFSEAKNPQSDIYGRVYEYYIGKFAQAEGSGAGQFFTPGSVVRPGKIRIVSHAKHNAAGKCEKISVVVRDEVGT
jgi:type I restriction enzyme M protein